MNANIFLKENGLKKCSRIVEDLIEQGNESEFVKDLKRLVESHEYIESYGGLIESKRTLEMRHDIINLDGWDNLKQAIADMESCK